MLRIAFVVAAIGWTVLSLVLSRRQIAHVQANRGTVPADFAGEVTLAEHQKAADYTVARERLSMVETLVGLALSIGWAMGGIDLLYALVAGITSSALAAGVLFLIGTGVVQTVVGLPFDLVRAFRLEERFGFNRTTPAQFLTDRVKGWVMSLAVGVPLLLAALWVMHSASGLWWLWTWIGLLGLMVAAPTVYIRLIAPRFNRFTPLADGDLRRRIEALLEASGFRASGLFTMDASRRTAHGNAYFIGFGKTKRIVLFDTLIAKSTLAEIEAVVAHELGHFRHRHILFGLARGALMLLISLAAFGWLCRQDWLLPSFGVAGDGDALRLYVCLLLASVVGPLAAPLGNWISRRNEFQADDYARKAVGAHPMVSALTRFARDNATTLTPDPVYALAHYSHPPVPIRVRHLRAREAEAATGSL